MAYFGFDYQFLPSATASVKNIGTTRLEIQPEGTVCELLVVFDDMSERRLDAVELTIPQRDLASGEQIYDYFQWKIPPEGRDIVWFRIEIHVAAAKLEWETKSLIRARENS